MTQISPHFSLAELTRTAQPFDNTPGPAEVKALTALCVNVLEPIRDHFKKPVMIHSGYRSARVNAAVGSAPTSQHRKGEAADIEILGISNPDLAGWIAVNMTFDQLILEAYRRGSPNSGWVHVSYRPDRARRSVLTMTLGPHGPIYSPGLNI